MDALILAAGMGSRIRAVEPVKPLTSIHGRSLLDIAVCQLAGAGATRVFVATGYRGDEVAAALPGIARRAGIAVEARPVRDYREPNGHSVMAGAQGFAGDFLLVMADHILSRAVLAPLAALAGPVDGAVLAIDRRLSSPLIDPGDATWVATRADGTIRAIGKTISGYDAVDCGAFRAGPGLLDAIGAAVRDGAPGSLSDGMQRLADQGRATTVDIGDGWWIDVDDSHALDQARLMAPNRLPEIFGAGGVGCGAGAAEARS